MGNFSDNWEDDDEDDKVKGYSELAEKLIREQASDPKDIVLGFMMLEHLFNNINEKMRYNSEKLFGQYSLILQEDDKKIANFLKQVDINTLLPDIPDPITTKVESEKGRGIITIPKTPEELKEVINVSIRSSLNLDHKYNINCLLIKATIYKLIIDEIHCVKGGKGVTDTTWDRFLANISLVVLHINALIEDGPELVEGILKTFLEVNLTQFINVYAERACYIDEYNQELKKAMIKGLGGIFEEKKSWRDRFKRKKNKIPIHNEERGAYKK